MGMGAAYRLGLAAALAACAAALAGCGFTPLYAKAGVTQALSAMEIHVPRGEAASGQSPAVNRIGFLMGEDLEDALAVDRSQRPLYRLDITVEEHNFPRGLTVNDVNTRNETHVTVRYALTDLSDGRKLKAGIEPVEVSYPASTEPYAGIVAQQDAQARAASTAADWIRVDLAAYFADR